MTKVHSKINQSLLDEVTVHVSEGHSANNTHHRNGLDPTLKTLILWLMTQHYCLSIIVNCCKMSSRSSETLYIGVRWIIR